MVFHIIENKMNVPHQTATEVASIAISQVTTTEVEAVSNTLMMW